MPRTITITSEAYRFDELTADAKEKARDWYREGQFEDGFEFDCSVDDFMTVADILGINFKTHEVKLVSGKTRSAPNIWYSVSSCQGDGACFEGTYGYKVTAPAMIREHAPEDAELHRIADMLTIEQIRWGFGLIASIEKTSHHYAHENTVTIDVTDQRDDDRDVSDADKAIGELLRDLMRWFHNQLVAEVDYRSSDECVDESIEVNEYMFDEEGGRHAYA